MDKKKRKFPTIQHRIKDTMQTHFLFEQHTVQSEL